MKTIYVVLKSIDKETPEGGTATDTEVDSCWAIEENALTRKEALEYEYAFHWDRVFWIEESEIGDLIIN